jgi:hypothetical protein
MPVIRYHQHTRFELTSDDASNNWCVGFDIVGDTIIIELYWGDKREPTHTFEMLADDFLDMTMNLMFRRQK